MTVNDMYIALSGAVAQERQLQVTSHNLADVSASGFKRDELLSEAITPTANFDSIWRAQMDLLDKSESIGLNQDFPYVRSQEKVIDLTPGQLANTSIAARTEPGLAL